MHFCNKGIEATTRWAEFRAGKLYKCRIFFSRPPMENRMATKWLGRKISRNRKRGKTSRARAECHTEDMNNTRITQNVALEVREVPSLIHLDSVN